MNLLSFYLKIIFEFETKLFLIFELGKFFDYISLTAKCFINCNTKYIINLLTKICKTLLKLINYFNEL